MAYKYIKDAKNYQKKYYIKFKNKIKKRERNYRNKIRKVSPCLNRLRSIKSNCKKTKMAFHLDKKWVLNNYTGRCSITNIPFVVTNKACLYSSSIDRIDNNKGYIKDNCRIILFGINVFKRDGTDNDILKIAKALIKNKHKLKLKS